MALFRYLHPVDGALDPQGPLSKTVPSVVIREVNNEVKRVETRLPKKQGTYLTFTAEEKAQVVKYGSTSGVRCKGATYYIIRDRESPRKLKPRKFLLSDITSFSRKFTPPKITRYTV